MLVLSSSVLFYTKFLEKAVQKKGGQYLCSQDMQKQKIPMKHSLQTMAGEENAKANITLIWRLSL